MGVLTPGQLEEILHSCEESGLQVKETTDQLYGKVYDQLRGIARHLMRSQPQNHTLQATELVHEAYTKLIQSSGLEWRDRIHFLAVSSKAMRHILVDHARRRATQRHGGRFQRIGMNNADGLAREPELDTLELHEALKDLEAKDARMAKLVELRAFSGMTAKEAAHVLGISKRTADAEWKVARLWLAAAMRQ